MGLRERLAPRSGEQILLVVLLLATATAVAGQLGDLVLAHWAILFGGTIVLGWAVWAVHYRLEQAQRERYRRNRSRYR